MEHLDEVVARLMRAAHDPMVPAGRLTLGDPATPAELRTVREYLGDTLADALQPLLDVCAGFGIDDADAEHAGGSYGFWLSAHNGDLAPQGWAEVYPHSIECCIAEEVIYWDVAGGKDGPVFLVCHDGPDHCMLFAGLGEYLVFLLTEPNPFEKAYGQVHARKDWPPVREFDTDDAGLAYFLASFPPHYRVIDLRGQPLKTAFTYDGGETEFTRWGDELVWVQRRRPGLKSRLSALALRTAEGVIGLITFLWRAIRSALRKA